jgi:hydrogenase/urease accessory protein HupE
MISSSASTSSRFSSTVEIGAIGVTAVCDSVTGADTGAGAVPVDGAEVVVAVSVRGAGALVDVAVSEITVEVSAPGAGV